MKKRILALFLTLTMALTLLPTTVFAAKTNRLSGLKDHEVLAALPYTLQRPARPTKVEQIGFQVGLGDSREGWLLSSISIDSAFEELLALTDSLIAGKTTDTEKVKAIFDWVSQNIKYDINRGSVENDSTGGPVYTYVVKRGVCQHYAVLCLFMCTIAEIPAAFIFGKSSSSDQPGGGHAWNAAFVDGDWLFFDATWRLWDMAPDYHDISGDFDCYDGTFELQGTSDDDGNVSLTFRNRKGFESPASVTVPSYGVTNVAGFDSYHGGGSLTEMTLVDTVTTIDTAAFSGCANLTKVTIPNSVTCIGSQAFSGCTSLKQLTIPDSVTSLEDGLFMRCTSLTDVNIPSRVTAIENSMFYECSSLEKLTIPNNITAIGSHAFMRTGLKDITIPGSVASIGEQAFMECADLETVKLNDGLKTIGKLAFFQCTNLKKADLPDSVTSIDSSAFSECPNLPRRDTIPGGVTEIEAYAFRGNDELVSFVIPDHVTRIGHQSFKDCKNLKSVTIPESVTTIDMEAFSGCTSLESITLPSGVTTIASNAFSNTGLTSVTIPDTITSIGNNAFASCKNLTSVTIPASVTEIGDQAFQRTPWLTAWLKEQGEFAVMNHILIKYQGAGGAVSIPSGVTAIGGGAFSYSGVTSVVIPDSVTSIGDNAFSYCSKLASATIPNSVTKIGDNAFSNCTSLTGAAIPNSVTSIGLQAFMDCTGLTTVIIGSGVTSIGARAFSNCKNLTAVILPTGITSIGPSAFSRCEKLASVVIPASVTKIESDTFSKCPSLLSVTIPNSVTSIHYSAFSGSGVRNVFYTGSKEEWKAVDLGAKNALDSADVAIHYNSPMPDIVVPEMPVQSVQLAYPSTQSVLVDGLPVEFQCYALKDVNGNDTNYIKLRDIASILSGTAVQFEVGWDGAVNIETGKGYTPNGSEMSTPFSGPRAYEAAAAPTNINGVKAGLDAIVLKDDQGGAFTYYKLRDLGAALNFKVDWSAQKGIFIETR